MRGQEGRKRKNLGKRNVVVMRQQQIQDPRSIISSGASLEREIEMIDDKWHIDNVDKQQGTKTTTLQSTVGEDFNDKDQATVIE